MMILPERSGRLEMFAHWGRMKWRPEYFSLWNNLEYLGDISVATVLAQIERLMIDGAVQARFRAELNGAISVGPPQGCLAPPVEEPDLSAEVRIANRRQRRARSTGP